MILFYCPECGKEEIKNVRQSEIETTFVNIRDGYGRPITHYKCECGNILAGSINVSGWENDKFAIRYAKDTIKGYNKGGCYYNDELYKYAEKCYNDNLKRQRRTI